MTLLEFFDPIVVPPYIRAMTREDKAFNFRIPAKLRSMLDKEARKHRQSLNAYLLTLVETHPGRASSAKR